MLPVSARLDTPSLINPEPPLTTPPRVSGFTPSTVRFAFKVIALLVVSAALLCKVPAPATVKAPVPSAAALPNVSVPAFKVVPPWKVLVPLRINSPVPALLTPAAPEITPLRFSPVEAPCTVKPPVPRVIRLASVKPLLVASIAPPLDVSTPLPNVALLLNCATPPLSVVLPLTNGPCNVQVPLLMARLLKLT